MTTLVLGLMVVCGCTDDDSLTAAHNPTPVYAEVTLAEVPIPYAAGWRVVVTERPGDHSSYPTSRVLLRHDSGKEKQIQQFEGVLVGVWIDPTPRRSADSFHVFVSYAKTGIPASETSTLYTTHRHGIAFAAEQIEHHAERLGDEETWASAPAATKTPD